MPGKEVCVTDNSDDFIPEIQNCDGTDSDYLKFFFDLILQIKNINSWSEDQTIKFIKTKLQDEALSFFRKITRKKRCNTVHKIYSRFQAHFSYTSPKFTLNDLEEVKMLPNESMKCLRQRLENIILTIYGKTHDIAALHTLLFTFFVKALPIHLKDQIVNEGIDNFHAAVDRANELHNFSVQDNSNEDFTQILHNPSSNENLVLEENNESLLPNFENTDESFINSNNVTQDKNSTKLPIYSKSEDLTHSSINNSISNVNMAPNIVNETYPWEDPLLSIPIEDIRKEQSNDDNLNTILKSLTNTEKSCYFVHHKLQVLCLALKGRQNDFRIVIPKSLTSIILEEHHKKHESITKMLFTIRKTYTWTQMFYDVKNVIINCKRCICHKNCKESQPQQLFTSPNIRPSIMYPVPVTPQCQKSQASFMDSGIFDVSP